MHQPTPAGTQRLVPGLACVHALTQRRRQETLPGGNLRLSVTCSQGNGNRVLDSVFPMVVLWDSRHIPTLLRWLRGGDFTLGQAVVCLPNLDPTIPGRASVASVSHQWRPTRAHRRRWWLLGWWGICNIRRASGVRPTECQVSQNCMCCKGDFGASMGARGLGMPRRVGTWATHRDSGLLCVSRQCAEPLDTCTSHPKKIPRG